MRYDTYLKGFVQLNKDQWKEFVDKHKVYDDNENLLTRLEFEYSILKSLQILP